MFGFRAINISSQILFYSIHLPKTVKRGMFFSAANWKSTVTGSALINGVSLHYNKSGDSSNAVVCIPGALGTASTDFGPQLSSLSKYFTVVSFDPRGYGQSIPPEREFLLDFYERDAEDAASLMVSLGFKKFSVLGWSDGGISGLILAALKPELVKKLVIWGSQAYLTARDVELLEPIRDLSKWSEKMRAPLEDTYGKERLHRIWNGWFDGFLAFQHQPNGDICMDAVRKVQCPTFVIHGKKDPIVPDYHPKYLMKNLKNAKYYEFEHGKHNPHLRFFEEFNKVVAEFLLQE